MILLVAYISLLIRLIWFSSPRLFFTLLWSLNGPVRTSWISVLLSPLLLLLMSGVVYKVVSCPPLTFSFPGIDVGTYWNISHVSRVTHVFHVTHLFLTRGWEYRLCPDSLKSDRFSSSRDIDSKLIAGLGPVPSSNIIPETIERETSQWLPCSQLVTTTVTHTFYNTKNCLHEVLWPVVPGDCLQTLRDTRSESGTV